MSEVIYRVNPMTVTQFTEFLRRHGIPCSPETTRAWIEAGVFGDAAIACPTSKVRDIHGELIQKYTYAIIPKRVEKWFRDNADEERVVEGA